MQRRRVVSFYLAQLQLLLFVAREGGGGLTNDLRLLVLSPYPSTKFHDRVGWHGGPALFPAAQFAADEINKRTDLLPSYKLSVINGDSGCSLEGRATETFVREREIALKEDRPIVGIVGPACATAAVEIGGITTPRYADIPSITVSTGVQLRQANFTNMLRLYNSAMLSAVALAKLMKYAKWTRVAAIVDTSHWYFPQIYRSFRELVQGSDSVEILNADSPFVYLRNRFNVVIVFANSRDSAKYLCMAREEKLVYPHCQWIFFDLEYESIFGEDVNINNMGQKYTCNREQLKEAFDRAILIKLRNYDGDSYHTYTGMNFFEFNNTHYRDYYIPHLNKLGLTHDNISPGSEEWAAAYYDSIWAFALAINNTYTSGNSNLQSVHNVSRKGFNLTASSIKNALLSLNFSGITGNIHFDVDTFEVPSVLNVSQLNKETPYPVLIGTFYEDTITIDNDIAVLVEPIKREIILIHKELAILFFIAGVVVLIVIAGIQLVYVVFRHFQPIRAQSPHFFHMIFSGCYLYVIAALLHTVRVANWTGYSDIDSKAFGMAIGTICNAVIWCLNLATVLIFGTMCALSWRIYRIFNHFLHPGKSISDPFLAGLVSILIAINIAVLVAWSASDPLLPRLELANNGLTAGVLLHYGRCDCENLLAWLSVWILNGLVVALVVVFAIFNRHVPRKDYINNTRSYNATVYFTALINGTCAVIYILLAQISEINASYVFFQLFTMGSTVSVVVLLFIPPVIPLIKYTLKQRKYHEHS